MTYRVATPAGPFVVSVSRDIWNGPRFLIATSGDGVDIDHVRLRGRAYRLTLRLEEVSPGQFAARRPSGLLGWAQRRLPDGRWIRGDVLLPADRALVAEVSERLVTWAAANAPQLARQTVEDCRTFLQRLSLERRDRETEVAAERAKLAYLDARGWNSDRVGRRLRDHEQWLTRCDRWEAMANDTIERFASC